MVTRSNALLIMKLKRFITFNLLSFFTVFDMVGELWQNL